MPVEYRVIEVFTSEEARWEGRPVWEAILDTVRRSGLAARCTVSRAMAGCYENGEMASGSLEVLSFNMPLKVEVILPAAQLDELLPRIEQIVTDGIVAVEDMQVRVHRAEKRLIPRQLRVKDAMTPSPHTVSPSTPLAEVVRLLLTHSFNGVPVIDEEGRPAGIITQKDLIRRAGMPLRLGLLARLGEHEVGDFLAGIGDRTAADVMTTPVVTVREDQRLSEAVELMLHRGLKRLPVVDPGGRLTGILSRFDVFRTIASESPDWQKIREQRVTVANVRTVGDIMRRDAHSVPPDAPLEEVARLIDDSDIQRVAVVDADGRLLGLVSDADLLSVFLEHRAGLWDLLKSRLGLSGAARRQAGGGRTAGEIMKTGLLTVREETRIDEAIRLMAEHGIKRLPVVDEAGRFLGLVSRDSLLRAGLEQAP